MTKIVIIKDSTFREGERNTIQNFLGDDYLVLRGQIEESIEVFEV